MTPILAGGLYVMLRFDPDVSPRLVSQLRLELRRYLVEPDALSVIAMGSSQTHMLFDEVADESEELSVYWLAGMNTLDYLIHQQEILDSRADKVLLNLSGFDLGKLPPLETVKSIRLSGSRAYVDTIYGIWSLRGSYSDQHLFEAGVGMLLTQLFPEFRFSEPSRRLLMRNFLPRAAARKAEHTQRQGQEDFRTQWLRELPPEPLEANMVMLKRFIDNAIAAEKEIYILQGHYRSDGHSLNNRRLEATVERRLRALASGSPQVHYLGTADLPPMTDADYKDPWHTTNSFGRDYANKVLAGLRAPRD